MKTNYLCGLSSWHPEWLQRFATSKSFIMVYGFLGTTQAMAYIYFVITLTTLEKRFKIPSSTTGIILSGNEISQILLSLILSYVGGHRNRPRWIAWGVVFCALSCFILASPHFIYGAGEAALQLTKEFISDQEAEAILNSHNFTKIVKSTNRLCLDTFSPKECHEIISIVPLVLIFMSQFVLGIGNTLYYSLGQTYLDDNTKKTNTPLMLAYASSLRTFGPVVGFALGYFTLKIYIDPTKTPVIDSSDPRWLGAWWLGWIILGLAMLIFAVLIGLFPKDLPVKKKEISRPKSNMPVVLMNDAEAFGKEKNPLSKPTEPNNHLTPNGNTAEAPLVEFPQLKDFPKALMRLLKNKLLMFNIISGIFYILGSSGYITFLSKYIEVQFHKSTANATVITGPITLFGMVAGFLISGIVISKKKPSPKILLFWNVIVGVGYMMGQFSYLFLTCPDGSMPLMQGKLNLSAECNSHCHCDGIPYSPICQEDTGITFFSGCHAGCDVWNASGKFYDQCTCQDENYSPITRPWLIRPSHTTEQIKFDETTTTEQYTPLVTSSNNTSITTTTLEYSEYENYPKLKSLRPLQNNSEVTANQTTEDDSYIYDDDITDYLDRLLGNDGDGNDGDFNVSSSEEPQQTRKRRDVTEEQSSTTSTPVEEAVLTAKLIPGACLKGCAMGFYLFSIISSIINCFGASGRIGNLLVNYRCVAKEDKSFTQGLILMMISLFALIPGPIIYGRIIDSTCLVWTEECGSRGNCQLYDQRLFRYYINLTALGLTAIGVFFDILVWWYGRSLDLYGDQEAQQKKMAKTAPKIAFT
ncbi:solute carrier organic anion transporter family member 74D [Malaya genurostris]|uniref:solute carrier organic anion transporter family member 74D n=1 Tax=Malaya genurostris TaxID=325434 RepID=UPI0026F3A7D5|nr:solute carrier organic anion transporter family member 74D [Malaya genurostris]XP_058446035.1 solute carrier organic anion transporter family member 74D [Malaya genurostris]XP_058446036.1 solute carrier organic anion transporter family member 74D [Malaya genurostris]XP_058446037.1 solute carrier organic anion transporter family member 74D [Malaya genurostris]XP_058446038.1 solute carrier organic anion transporter family member 74D [Malaya genurostris]XP_058446039.1 solute carrier organic an